jgi:hypothetical protein
MNEGHSFRVNPPVQSSCGSLLGTIVIVLVNKGGIGIIFPIILKTVFFIIKIILLLLSSIILIIFKILCCSSIAHLLIILYLFNKLLSNPKFLYFFLKNKKAALKLSAD